MFAVAGSGTPLVVFVGSRQAERGTLCAGVTSVQEHNVF